MKENTPGNAGGPGGRDRTLAVKRRKTNPMQAWKPTVKNELTHFCHKYSKDNNSNVVWIQILSCVKLNMEYETWNI